MKSIDEALIELESLTNDACNGMLTDTECRKRFAEFRHKYGDDLIYGSELGALKDEPATKDKLRKLRSLQAQGSTSEETFLEMARTGRALRRKKLAGIIIGIVAFAAVIAAIVSIISIFRK